MTTKTTVTHCNIYIEQQYISHILISDKKGICKQGIYFVAQYIFDFNVMLLKVMHFYKKHNNIFFSTQRLHLEYFWKF